MKISYNWLKSYIPQLPDANKIADVFTYHLTEVEGVEENDGDTIFDINILPNRAHDLLSHQGVAFELASQLGLEFKDPTPLYKTPASKETNLKIEIESLGCRRYMGRIVHNIKVGPSPEWVVKYLESIGQRSINNIVDATNIVMYDCGQPSHAFDLAKLKEEKIFIKNALSGTELPVVGREGIVAKLLDTDVVITSGGENIALAGVKGGADSGISENTKDIVLEIANFNPVSVRKTARRLGLLSDSAKRFENDLSLTLCDFAMLELSALIADLCLGAVFEDVVDAGTKTQEERKIKFTTDLVNQKLGSSINNYDIENILKNYKYVYSCEGEDFTITVPSMRLDLEIPEDMVEEIGRIYGYDKLKPELPKINFQPKANEVYVNIQKARSHLIAQGYKEVMTYTFKDLGEVEVLASASDKKFLRTNLIEGLKKSYELNKLNSVFLNMNEIKIFEIGTVFKNGSEVVNVAYINKKESKEMSLNEFISLPDATSEILSKKSSNLLANTKGELGQTIFESTSDSAIMHNFKMWSLYPLIYRDIAVWVPEGTEKEKLSSIYKEFGTELLQRDPILVDTFTKEGRTSYAFRLIFQSYDRTLKDEEISLIMANIESKIASLGYESR